MAYSSFKKNNSIMVGIDGSASSKVALEWAAEEAGTRGAELHVFHAWQFPSIAYTAYPGEVEDLEAAGTSILEEAKALMKSEYPDLKVHYHLSEGNPVSAITDFADKTDLVVVGSRGRGGFSSLVIGSVSTQLTHHCLVPLVIIHSA